MEHPTKCNKAGITQEMPTFSDCGAADTEGLEASLLANAGIWSSVIWSGLAKKVGAAKNAKTSPSERLTEPSRGVIINDKATDTELHPRKQVDCLTRPSVGTWFKVRTQRQSASSVAAAALVNKVSIANLSSDLVPQAAFKSALERTAAPQHATSATNAANMASESAEAPALTSNQAPSARFQPSVGTWLPSRMARLAQLQAAHAYADALQESHTLAVTPGVAAKSNKMAAADKIRVGWLKFRQTKARRAFMAAMVQFHRAVAKHSMADEHRASLASVATQIVSGVEVCLQPYCASEPCAMPAVHEVKAAPLAVTPPAETTGARHEGDEQQRAAQRAYIALHKMECCVNSCMRALVRAATKIQNCWRKRSQLRRQAVKEQFHVASRVTMVTRSPRSRHVRPATPVDLWKFEIQQLPGETSHPRADFDAGIRSSQQREAVARPRSPRNEATQHFTPRSSSVRSGRAGFSAMEMDLGCRPTASLSSVRTATGNIRFGKSVPSTLPQLTSRSRSVKSGREQLLQMASIATPRGSRFTVF